MAAEEKQSKFVKSFSHIAVDYGFTKILFIDEMPVCTSARTSYGLTLNECLIVDTPQRNKVKADYFGTAEVLYRVISRSVKKLNPKTVRSIVTLLPMALLLSIQKQL